MFYPFFFMFIKFIIRFWYWLILGVFLLMFIVLAFGKTYQHWENDTDRGAIAIEGGAFGESYSTPIYLDEQGWDLDDSLWFYNTTQGSALLPYDFFMVLEEEGTEELLRSNKNMDKFRYLPQKKTFFNPDALPVGFVKESYEGKDYVGFTCAACHTGQINYKGVAIRIDGAPAMANMEKFLHSLMNAMASARSQGNKDRFVDKVLALNNDYKDRKAVEADLTIWAEKRRIYNIVNSSNVEYGYARLDAFGRIYNRVIQYTLNQDQLRSSLSSILGVDNKPILSTTEIDRILLNIDPTIINDEQFALLIERLESSEPGYPNLDPTDLLRIKDTVFIEPNAPVSYPALWDVPYSDYVQWNGLASNAGIGPLGRNTGEVIGVFAKLDWHAQDPSWSISGWLTGQKNKRERVDFKSSVDLINLQRLEAHLRSLKSPMWPESKMADLVDEQGKNAWKIDPDKASTGKSIYAKHCLSCHEIINREGNDRRVIAKMLSLEKSGTDEAMAWNSVNYTAKSGNFKHTYQDVGVGTVIIEEQAPIVQVLTSVTRGVVATASDPDKSWIRRRLDWLYTLFLAFIGNDITASIKSGDYIPDTTTKPYNSLLAYKARPLNGIWATAPYLHNGSVPTLYDLLLPAKGDGNSIDGKYRPDTFMVGSREFDPEKVGFKTEGYEGSKFDTSIRGNYNTGHRYGFDLLDTERWQLVEYLKTL